MSICPHHRVIFLSLSLLSLSIYLAHSLYFFYPRTFPHHDANVDGPSGAMAAAAAVVGRRHAVLRAFRRAKWPTDSCTHARTNAHTTQLVRLSATTPTHPYLHVNISSSRIFPLLLFLFFYRRLFRLRSTSQLFPYIIILLYIYI